ncbi:cytochrome c oxidase subunit II [Desulforhopalus sp. IMCC35007]|uniref:cytochrome c oxidase subunit II n=1 Tax=Desulforhopalus sp. IMCC35007 TaxID=2569543 RepID=UPI0010ADD455|nr:cytochrome c oxidase subunit II [Desulforhopalus sp. IMCC35007]TKB06474.1 cytochrome c oxidase subunit II [Desulforhopalus sp. IMCC35007]
MDPVLGVDRAFWYIFGVSLILLIGITAVMIYFVVRYRRSKNPVPSDIRGDWKLELIWSIIPTFIALSMFWIGWSSYTGLRNVPDDAIEVEVLGQMFSWIFIYDNDKETENELVVPVNTPVKLNIESLDVIHSFFIPAFRVKVDAVKGLPTYLTFTPKEEGEFDIFCAEYCGTDHSYMTAKLRVVPNEEYEEWLEEEE